MSTNAIPAPVNMIGDFVCEAILAPDFQYLAEQIAELKAARALREAGLASTVASHFGNGETTAISPVTK